ncbi:ornithine cyclodeaminase family protein [Vagococcus sp. PNs007]|uniref:Ornithine cyclodeaminase family protein n=1 Tax=Vagococcus proximus TaxID=2991417 RepID=A0ABT5WY63_9ENTE|nr:ornithine cyclodeaminase family protein [Vagococcus proximus]MDF0478695.1 ornithine cyclodeaminase family protein [Vagococcus proximus]
MLVLSKEDIQNCFTMKEAIEADKEALRLYTEGKTQVPLRVNLNLEEQNGQSLFMPAYSGGAEPSLGVKIVSVYPDNYKKGLPNLPATMIVLNPETGVVDAIVDGTYLTQLRTGAVQGAATDLLANKSVEIGALIGTGGQAESQLEAMLTVREFKQINVYDRDIERAEVFCESVSKLYPNVTFKATKTPKETVADADVITTVTTSKMPTFDAVDVKKGAHVNGVGSYTPVMKEIPAELIKVADSIIFDTTEGVMAEAGDFIDPIKDGVVTEQAYTGELGQLVLGQVKGRQAEEDLTIFKTVGSAVLDSVTAQKIVDKARQLGLGKEIN